MLNEKTGIPVAITNDAKAAALGEMSHGAAMGMKDFIEITLGTGVGSGIVANGNLIYGSDGFAGALGHSIMFFDNGRKCGCGRSGCLDMYCSSRGVVMTAKEMLAEEGVLSSLANIPADKISMLPRLATNWHKWCSAAQERFWERHAQTSPHS